MARLALVAALLAACAAPMAETGAAETWLEPTDALYEAQQAWGLPVAEGTHLEVLPVDAYLARCAELEGEMCSPRSLEVVDHQSKTILVRDDLTAEQLRFVKIHALGHLLRGGGGHLECDGPGGHVMCVNGRVNAANTAYVPELTPADFDFVLTPAG